MRKIQVNVDTRRLSFFQPQGLFDHLLMAQSDGVITYDDFSLRLPQQEQEADEAAAEAAVDDEAAVEPPTEINADLMLADGEVLGQFRFNNTPKYRGLAFFTFANKALYDYGSGCAAMLDVATSQLGLELCALTQTDIALDVNCNIYPHIMRFVRDAEHFDMILNGDRVDDANRTLQGIGEWFARSRKKRERFPTLYFEHKRADGLKIRVYDKSKEIEESGKSYIAEHNGFGATKTYRVEIVVKWVQFKQWQRHICDVDTIVPNDDWKLRTNETLHEHMKRTNALYLGDSDYCLALWSWAADHVLYFREKATNRKVSLFDIVSGTV